MPYFRSKRFAPRAVRFAAIFWAAVADPPRADGDGRDALVATTPGPA